MKISVGVGLGSSGARGPMFALGSIIQQFEGNSGSVTFAFPVVYTGNGLVGGSVDWTVVAGTATSADFAGGVLPSGTLTFATTDTLKYINVSVVGDTTFELDETFSIQLSNPVNGIIAVSSGLGTILNDDADPTPTISLNTTPVVQFEGNSGTVTYTYSISRTGTTTGSSSVAWAVTGSGTNPANATDFGGTLPSGTLTFAAGETAKNIVFTASGDNTVEPDETFTLTISSPTNAYIGTSSVTGTILNDDAYPTTVSDLTVGSITATGATLSYTPSTGATSHEYRLNGGTATTLASNTLSGLTSATAYTVEVRGVNVSGAGAWSNVANFTTQSLPGTVSDLSVSSFTTTTATLSFSAASNATSYNYRLNGGSASALAGNKIITGLTQNTAYSIEVQGVNAYGTGSWSNLVNMTTTAATPSTVSDLSTTSTTSTGTTLTYTSPTPITSMQYRLNGGTATTLSSNTLSGLTASTAYTVEVRGVNNGVFGGWSNVANFTTTSAGILSDLIASGKVIALWDAQDSTNLAQSSGSVSSWTDSVSGLALTQATAGAQPTYSATSFNGAPGVTFDGTTDWMSRTGALPSTLRGASEYEIVALVDVTALDSDVTTRYVFALGEAGVPLKGRMLRTLTSSGVNVAGSYVGQANSSIATVQMTSANPVFGRHVLGTGYDATTGIYTENDGVKNATPDLTSPPNTGNAAGTEQMVLGNSNFSATPGNGNNFKGVVSLVTIVKTLTTSERSSMMSQFAARTFSGYVLLEDGTYILAEDGSKILKE